MRRHVEVAVADSAVVSNADKYRSSRSYDFDTSPDKRAQKPDFYGYVPDGPSERTIVFCALVTNSSLMLAIRSLALVLLSFVSLKYVILYFAVDMGLYLGVKFFRDDMIYW